MARSRWVLLLWMAWLQWMVLGEEASSSSSSLPSSVPVRVRAQQEALQVIELTAQTFDSQVLFGERNTIWLVEFYATWCSHCTAFAPAYQRIAAKFHREQLEQKPNEKKNLHTTKIKVARVDATAEQALTSRFGVNAFPSFYVIDGLRVYEFKDHRTKSNLEKFAQGGYRQQAPIPFYASPMGPVGLAQGLLILLGLYAAGVLQWVQTTLGVSPVLAAIVLFGVFFMGLFVTFVILAIVVTPKLKND